MTDADGVPLVVQTTPANVNDEKQLPALLEGMPAVQGPRGRPRSKPGGIFGDRAYGTAEMVTLVIGLSILSFLAPRNDDTHGSGLGIFRYVVERTLACFSHFRRLRMCYER
ncbi:transposase [Fontivita pretiosa]|uniref:transposase n=1 Tax=Fontivita pretiosa TaxID=2989684 RepID=UPI003D17855B